MQLNPAQEQVASHVRGRILTLAGPGSGKTKTLTERTGRLIKLPACRPSNVLCLTFTNKARDEMRDRIIVGARQAVAAKVFISNFHGLCRHDPAADGIKRDRVQ